MESQDLSQHTLKLTSKFGQSAVLSRQTSFDEDGVTKLSSSQVRQRLKAHVLNRRRRSEAADNSVEEYHPAKSNTGSGSLVYESRNFIEATTRWHSADSADPSLLRAPGEFTTSNMGYTGTASPMPQIPDRAVLEMIEQLSMLSKGVCSSADSSLGGYDIRKTISAPNLFENPWPLRIVSQLVMNHPDLFVSSNPASTVASRQTPLPTANPLDLSSELASSCSKTIGSAHLAATSINRVASSSGDASETAETVNSLQVTPHTPVLRHISRPPLESSASEDSAVERSALEWKMRSYLTEMMLNDRHAVSSALPVKHRVSTTGSLGICTDMSMDWEPDEKSNGSQSHTTRNTSTPQAKLQHPIMADGTDIPDAWAKLPVEDWLSSSKNYVVGDSPQSLSTGLAFDPDMLQHSCLCPTALDIHTHPECSTRVSKILEHLSTAPLRIPPSQSADLPHLLQQLKATHESPIFKQALDKLLELGLESLRTFLEGIPLMGFCRLFRGRMASEDELCLFHSREHVQMYCSPVGPGNSDPYSPSFDSNSSQHIQGHPRLCKLACGGVGVDSDTVWNPKSTARAARLAVGQMLCLAHKVAKRQLRNGFALVRPPGHHAEPSHAMGFCYFNSVAVAALYLLQTCSLNRVLILDWDIHHGNGTKFVTKQHPGVVYVSIHRFDRGTFFPGTGSIANTPCRVDDGIHSSTKQLVNIAWETPSFKQEMSTLPYDAGARRELWRQYCSRMKTSHPEYQKQVEFLRSNVASSNSSHSATSTHSCSCLRSRGTAPLGSAGSSPLCSLCLSQSIRSSLSSTNSHFSDAAQRVDSAQQRSLIGFGDAEYLAAFRCVVLPIAHEFQPEIILISAGFDPAPGHGEALGGYTVSPGTFAWITRQCLSVCNGRVVLALEGGYNPSVVGECVAASVNSLLLPDPSKKWVPGLPWPDVDGCSDAYQSACDLIPFEELNRTPHPEAVNTLIQVAQHQSQNGWRSMQYVHRDNVALSFSEAIEFERRLALQTCNKSNSSELSQQSAACNSPLTSGFAQLRMDQS